jgi:hypothetical protein
MKYSKGKNPNSRNGFQKGYTPWNKGTKGVTIGHPFPKGHSYWDNPNSERVRFKKGQKNSKEARVKMSKSHLGVKLSDTTRRKMSLRWLGNKNPRWKGGFNSKNMQIRLGIEFRLWREAVFARDNWTCQKYGIKGGKLHPHHMKNFAQYPELRFAIDNGVTLSEKAHQQFHKKYGKKNNTKEQLEEFLKEGIRQ